MGDAWGELIVHWQSWTRIPRFGPAFRMGESVEGDDQKLQRLKHIAGQHGYDIVQLPEGAHQPGRGWRVVKTVHKGLKQPRIVFGGPIEGWGVTLDEVEAYLEML
jgi:hypothetical protein